MPSRKAGGTPRVSTIFSLSVENEQAGAGGGRPNLSRKTTFSGSNRNREKFIFPVQLTTRGIANLTQLIHTLLRVFTLDTRTRKGREEGEKYQEHDRDISGVEEVRGMVTPTGNQGLQLSKVYCPREHGAS